MAKRKIPVCAPCLGGNEEAYVLDAVRSSWISSSGRYIDEFEKGFCNYLKIGGGTSCANGTAALHLALKAVGIGPEDEVIVQDFTMIATALAVCYSGAKLVLVDNEPDTWNIDVRKIEERIGPKTKAIIVAHIYGHPADMDPILDIARRRGLLLIEDAAEVHGALYRGKKCGTFGDVAAFSFYANKIITTGEGGMVVSDDPAIIQRVRYYKNLCFPVAGARNYIHEDIGFNYRMGNLQAAVGLAQLEKIEHYVARRRKNADCYNRLLECVEAIQRPVEKAGARNVYWMYGVVIDEGARLSRDEMIMRLAEDGIESRPFFSPLHIQPALKKYGMQTVGDFQVSDWLGRSGLYLPSGSGLKEDDIAFVCDRVKTLLA
jgi:perosamine synthetase